MRAAHRARQAALLVAVTVAALAGCGGDEAGQAGSASATAAVAIDDFSFAPPHITVTAGTTVDFTNHDSTAHTATARGGAAFDSGTIAPGKSRGITLREPGTYSYYCAFHPFMTGTITVER
jgi:plastocyanin